MTIITTHPLNDPAKDKLRGIPAHTPENPRGGQDLCDRKEILDASGNIQSANGGRSVDSLGLRSHVRRRDGRQNNGKVDPIRVLLWMMF